MLARTYKTHAELGISLGAYNALFEVKHMLASGKIPHGHHCPQSPRAKRFNMAYWRVENCGTIGCIGGYTEWVLGRELSEDDADVLNALFYPGTFAAPVNAYGPLAVAILDDVTVEQAVQAMDNFLMTGDPKWESMLTEAE